MKWPLLVTRALPKREVFVHELARDDGVLGAVERVQDHHVSSGRGNRRELALPRGVVRTVS
jgi:hypothetical protein